MRYFIYCRKSSDREDKQALSNEAQRRKMTQMAERLGLRVVHIFIERKSAYKTGRPQFNEMVRRLERGDADAVLTYHLTRLARNSFDGGRLIYFMDEGVVREIRTEDSTYSNLADDKFMMQIHFAMAKKSSDDTSQFVRRDIETKLLKGEFPGAVPLGYLNIDQKGTIAGNHYSQEKQQLLFELGRPLKREEVDPINGPIVKRIYEEASKGTHSLKALSEISYKLGLRSKHGKKLPQATIWNTLTNPYYYGAIRWNGKIYVENVQHEALVGKQLFDRVQQLLRRRGGGMKRHFFPFTGIFQCGECGCAITAEIQKGHIYYHCTYRKGCCSQRSWLKSEDLEEQVVAVIRRLVIPRSFLEFAFKRLRDTHKTESQVQNTARQSLERRYGVLKAKLDALLEFKLSPKNTSGAYLSDQEYLDQKNTIRTEMLELEQQRESYKKQADTWVGDCEKFIQHTQELAVKYGMATLEQKKELMLLLCSKATVQDGSVAFSYREPFASIVKLSEATDGRFEPPSSLPLKEESSLLKVWLPPNYTIKNMVMDGPKFDYFMGLVEGLLKIMPQYAR